MSAFLYKYKLFLILITRKAICFLVLHLPSLVCRYINLWCELSKVFFTHHASSESWHSIITITNYTCLTRCQWITAFLKTILSAPLLENSTSWQVFIYNLRDLSLFQKINNMTEQRVSLLEIQTTLFAGT